MVSSARGPREPIFNVTAGLPYRRRIVVEGAAAVWPDPSTVEVRSQVRKSRSVTSDLVFDLTPHLTLAYIGQDISITLDMTGEQTRAAKGGHIDMIMSDKGVVDARAIPVLRDETMAVDGLVTAAS